MEPAAAVRWEETPCPLCGARDEEMVLQTRVENASCQLVRCRRCQMVYLNPRPDESSLGRFYPHDYQPYSPRVQARTGLLARLRRKLEGLVLSAYFAYPPPVQGLTGRLAAALARPWLAPGRDSHTSIPYTGKGHLLDFGCGGGWFARRMADRGWKVIGMDFSEHAAAQVRERFKLPVYVGSLPHPAVRPESFDVINMGASLEHVPHPNRVLEAAVKALRPGGLLVASVPNFAGWVPRTFGTDWFSLDLPRHLLHFTPATLRRLLVAHGLVVEELRMLGRVSWLRRTLRNARTSGNTSWKRRLAALAPGLWTRWTVWSRQADCMMAIARKPASEALRLSA